MKEEIGILSDLGFLFWWHPLSRELSYIIYALKKLIKKLIIHFSRHIIYWSVIRHQELYDWNDHVKNKTPGNGKCSFQTFHLDYITNRMLSSYGELHYASKNTRQREWKLLHLALLLGKTCYWINISVG